MSDDNITIANKAPRFSIFKMKNTLKPLPIDGMFQWRFQGGFTGFCNLKCYGQMKEDQYEDEEFEELLNPTKMLWNDHWRTKQENVKGPPPPQNNCCQISVI